MDLHPPSRELHLPLLSEYMYTDHDISSIDIPLEISFLINI